MDEMRTERVAIARTESVFREVNERIAEGAERLDVQEANFLCECADPACTTGVPVTLEDYERVRANGTTFLLAPGHERRSIETVVARAGNHDVVEKRDPLTAEVALDLDPRTGGQQLH